MATGVLPLLLGKFTRLAQYFSSAEKSYSGNDSLWLCSTDTYDAEGQPSGPDFTPDLTLDQVRLQRPPASTARCEQMPPAYSAKKIAGKPAYKLARDGQPVPLKPATVHIVSFTITGLEGPYASFAMSISAGGYVRSVAHELGQDLRCGGHLSGLRRTRAGVFSLDGAHTLEELEKLAGTRKHCRRFPCIPACFSRKCRRLPPIPSHWASCATARKPICPSFPPPPW
jgi:tRNA pseudouridine55 synthase